MVMLGSPKETLIVEAPFFTQTDRFFGPLGVFQGLFSDLPLQSLLTRPFVISVSVHYRKECNDFCGSFVLTWGFVELAVHSRPPILI